MTTGDAGTASFAGVISGSGGLVKQGSGTFTLTGANTYTGTTTIAAGTLQLGAGDTSATLGGGAVVNNGALEFNQTATGPIYNVISGTGSLRVAANAFVALQGNNSYSGTTTIAANGALAVGDNSSTGTLGSGAVVNNGTLFLSRGNAATVANAISGNGELVIGGIGTTTLSGISSLSGDTHVNRGVLDITGSLGSQKFWVYSNGSLHVDGAAISNSASVILVNSGDLTLNGAETIGTLSRTQLVGSVGDTVNGTVTLGGNTLTVAAQSSGLGLMTFVGSTGTDRVAITLGAALANFSLAGATFSNWTNGTDSASITGNALSNILTGSAGNNFLNGKLGNDRLIGGAGNDTMVGGAGDDTYVVDTAGDRVFETTTTASRFDAGGIDTVKSAGTFGLDTSASVRFVERLTLTGTANIRGTGNALANTLTGNAGNNALNGGLGKDKLVGGAGSDAFVFRTALGASNVDQITDFRVVDDTIRLDDAVFAGLARGHLARSAFVSNLTGTATDSFDRIAYETDTGRLYFDADGTGAGARVHFATLSANLMLTNADFLVF